MKDGLQLLWVKKQNIYRYACMTSTKQISSNISWYIHCWTYYNKLTAIVENMPRLRNNRLATLETYSHSKKKKGTVWKRITRVETILTKD